MEPRIDLSLTAAGVFALASAGAIVHANARTMRARIAARTAAQTSEALLRAVRDLIAASRDSPRAVFVVLDRAIRACVDGVDAVAIFERRDDRLLCTCASGERLEHFKDRALGVSGETVCARAVRAGFRCVTVRPDEVLHPSDRVSLAVPLMGATTAFAVLSAGSRGHLCARGIELIVALVEQATPAYALALEREDDHRRANIDGLTGLLTPRAFRTHLKAELVRARSDVRQRLALVFVDTDHFKAWNDAYGHASGDAVLLRLAGMLRACASSGRDLVARNGGDEFCLVFADVEKSEAIARARALCAAISAHAWDVERPAGGAAAPTITASIGVAAFPRDALTPDELLERADAAMYHSKHEGRNCVSYYDEGVLVCAQGEPEMATMIDARDDREAGFTLIELMIVVAIIAILAGILIPNFINARAQAQTSACESNLRAIATAAELYYADQQQYPGNGATINADSTGFTPTGGSTYLNNTPRDPADPGHTGFYTFTDKSTAGNPAYVVSCPGQHLSQTLAKLQNWSTGDLYIKYDSGTGLLATGTKNDTGL